MSTPITDTHPPRPRRAHPLYASAATALVLTLLAVMTPSWYVEARSARWERTVANAPHTDVALVLGAGLEPDNSPTPFLAGRLDTAMELYRRGTVSVLFLSGARRDDDRDRPGYDEPAAMRRYLLAHGIPDEALVEDHDAVDTYESCIRSARIYGLRRVIVVTNDFHLDRAITLCRGAGMETYGVADTTAREISASEWRSMKRRERLAAGKAVLEDLRGAGPHKPQDRDDAVTRTVERATRSGDAR